MGIKEIKIGDIVESVSITHKFDKDNLYFLNTSDILDGKILQAHYMPINELKGQAKKTIEKHDILFSEIRPKNKRFAYVDIDDTENYVVSTKLMVLRNKNKEVDNKYFYYCLTNESMLNRLQMRAESRICSFPQITFDTLKNIRLKIPSIDKQKKIVDKLTTMDNKIFLNNQLISFLEEYAQLLFHKWFVDFNFPDEEGKPYKDNGGEMYEVDGEMIPVGWTREKIGKWKKAELIKSGILEFEGEKRYITTSDVVGIDINLGADKVNYGDRTSRANMQPELNSVWFAKMQNSPKHIFITEENFVESYILSTGFAGLRCDEISFPYIATFVNSRQFEEMKNLRCNGSTQKAINDEGIKTIKVVIPNEEVLSSFSKITYPIYKKINLLQQENQLLEETRDLLIKKLIK